MCGGPYYHWRFRHRNMDHNDPEVAEWFARINEAIRKDMLPKMRSSSFVMGIVEPELDAFLLMQVGAAVLLEKPLILLSVEGGWIPKKARELADAVIEVDSLKTPENKE